MFLLSLSLPHSSFSKLSPKESIENNQLAFSVAEEHLGVHKLLKPEEMARPDKLALFTYLSLFYELFVNAEPAEDVLMDTTPPPESVTPPRIDTNSRESSPMAEEEAGKSGKKSRSGSLSRLSKRLLRRRSSSKTRLALSPERSWNTKSVKRPTLSPPTSPIFPMLLETVPEVSCLYMYCQSVASSISPGCVAWCTQLSVCIASSISPGCVVWHSVVYTVVSLYSQ